MDVKQLPTLSPNIPGSTSQCWDQQALEEGVERVFIPLFV